MTVILFRSRLLGGGAVVVMFVLLSSLSVRVAILATSKYNRPRHFFARPPKTKRCPSQTGPPSKDRWLYRVIQDRPIRAIHKDRQTKTRTPLPAIQWIGISRHAGASMGFYKTVSLLQSRVWFPVANSCRISLYISLFKSLYIAHLICCPVESLSPLHPVPESA